MSNAQNITVSIVKDDKNKVANFSNQLRKRFKITMEMMARTNPGIHPIKKRHAAIMLSLCIKSPGGNPFSAKDRMHSTTNRAEVSKEAKARRKGNELLRGSSIQISSDPPEGEV